MLSLSDNNQTDIIEGFTSTSKYLDVLLNINNPYFEHMVGQIYPNELQLNKAADTEADCFALFVFLVSGDFCLDLPRDTTGLSAAVTVVFPDHTHYFLCFVIYKFL